MEGGREGVEGRVEVGGREGGREGRKEGGRGGKGRYVGWSYILPLFPSG